LELDCSVVPAHLDGTILAQLQTCHNQNMRTGVITDQNIRAESVASILSKDCHLDLVLNTKDLGVATNSVVLLLSACLQWRMNPCDLVLVTNDLQFIETAAHLGIPSQNCLPSQQFNS
jgi:hypothetical protein